MKSTTIKCSPCKGTGIVPGAKKWSAQNECKSCGGYGYNHPPKEFNTARRLLSGEKFFFLSAWEDDPKSDWDEKDFVELQGGGCLSIGDAESYDPTFDRGKNFFFTIKEAREAIKKIKAIINAAK